MSAPQLSQDTFPAALVECHEGTISAPVAAMRLLIAHGWDAARELAEDAFLRSGAQRVFEVLSLLRDESRRARCEPVLDTFRDLAPALGDLPAVEASRTLFDALVVQGEEATAALYSLGDPELLASASTEVVELFRARGVLGRHRTALDFGCGAGRFERALASELGSIVGVDVSERSLAAARRGAPPNVWFDACSGRDLAGFVDRAFDLVFAVDSFPYLHTADGVLLDGVMAEIARVLSHGGDLVILNYSYRGDPECDREDVVRMATRHGLLVLDAAARPFRIWDALAFHLRRV